MTDPELSRRRPIRSYVLREGRLTAAQQTALDRLWPRYGVPFTDSGDFDPSTLFDSGRPVWLEIGFGNGESLAAAAAANPDLDYLGVEVHRPGIGRLLLALEQARLENVRIIRRDAFDVLGLMLAPRTLAGLRLFFPDPWPKKRHHKRRIVRPEFVDLLARTLIPGGRIHAATDWEEYAEHMLALLRADPRFANLAADGRYVPRPTERPPTRFEERGRRLGHQVFDLMFERLDGVD